MAVLGTHIGYTRSVVFFHHWLKISVNFAMYNLTKLAKKYGQLGYVGYPKKNLAGIPAVGHNARF
jgi:hypothetical protein